MKKIPDYSNCTKEIDLYAFYGPSDGKYMNGTPMGDGTDFRVKERYQEYKDCGFDILLLLGNDTYNGEEFETSDLKMNLELCAKVGLKAIVHDKRLHDLSMQEHSLIGKEFDSFEKLVEYAAQKGVTIAFENQRKLGNIAWAFDNFENCDNVGFCWDCGHEACFTLEREYMPIFGKKLVCTHIHDNTAVFNADLHLLPFDGKIDYDRFAEHIRKSGYQGPLTLEVIAGNSKYYEGVDIDTYLNKAAEVIKKLRTMVDGEI
jgi:sugar phosphate isomerase/epimerase